ncbi:coenzyme F420-0:L-glutamate ligase [Sphingomonas bacterium]|uniref:coenzyme F420-0:L-glutamate ligase n=1 Tax=Sphingomonas bacterium TaxID=1895847 RepID=UPI0015752554|nr:coenzyme F420-0:L-glutamate ligase [Sphingomonas bacterium]
MVAPGDDLAGLIADALEQAGDRLADGDVLVVAQKVVSKAEGRLVRLTDVVPTPDAKAIAERAGKDPAVVTVVMAEAAEVMRVVPGVVITRHRAGHVLANSGVDASNALPGGNHVVLWPEDPDRSARGLRTALQARFGVRIAVIVSDSLGRAWRLGTIGTAIGSAGLKPLRDRRGEPDLFGRRMEATLIAVADEIASAASLVLGEAAEAVPAAIVRGAVFDADEDAGIGAILRPIAQDLFR